MKTEITIGLGLILVGIGLFLFTPFLLIWSVNGLFKMVIEYTWTNWFYAFIIMVLLRGSINYNKK
jgi:hypothetical protein